jgi:hypothetical protein
VERVEVGATTAPLGDEQFLADIDDLFHRQRTGLW